MQNQNQTPSNLNFTDAEKIILKNKHILIFFATEPGKIYIREIDSSA